MMKSVIIFNLRAGLLAVACWCLISTPSALCQQRKIDSLHAVLSYSHVDSVKVNALVALSYAYAGRARAKAREYAERAVSLAETVESSRIRARAYVALGFMHAVASLHTEAEILFRKALALALETDEGRTISRAYRGLGKIQYNLGRLDSALGYYAKALAVSTNGDDPYHRAQALRWMGNVFIKQGKHDQALEYHTQSLRTNESLGELSEIAWDLHNIAVVHALKHDTTKAIGLYRRSLTLFEQLDEKEGAGWCLNKLAAIYKHVSQPGNEREMLQRALVLHMQRGDSADIAATLINLGVSHYDRKDFDQAMEYFTKGLSIAESIAHKHWTANALYNIALILLRRDDVEKAIQYLTRCERLWEEAGVHSQIATPLYIMADHFSKRGRHEEALGYYHRFFELARKHGDKVGMKNACTAIGGIYQTQGKFIDALDMYKQALQIAEEIGGCVACELYNYARVYLNQGRFTRAREIYQQCLEQFERSGDTLRVALAHNGIGSTSAMEGRHDEAMVHYRRSLDLSTRIDNTQGVAASLKLIASIHAIQGREIEAMDTFLHALRLFNDLNDQYSVMEVLSSMACLKSQESKPDSVIKLAARQWELAKALGVAESRQKAAETLSLAYAAKGEYAKAYEYSVESAKLKDSLRNEINIRSLNEMSARFDAERREKALAMLAKENSLKSMEIEKTDMLLRLRTLALARARTMAELLEHEAEVQHLQLEKKQSEAEDLKTELRIQQVEKEHITEERELHAALASRELRFRNALLAVVALVSLVGFLLVIRIRSKRTEAMLRAEAAEYRTQAAEAQARTAEAASLRLVAEAERRATEAQHRFSQKLIAAQEQERRRIASDLHDGICQDILVIQNRAAVALRRGAMDEESRRQFEEIAQTAAMTMEGVREVSRRLRPAILERAGLTDTLRTVLDGIAETTDIQFDIAIDNIDGAFHRDHEIDVFRLVQESTNNILKHSQAKHASIKVVSTGSSVTIAITDNGKGFSLPQLGPAVTGLGMQSIAERVAMLRGSWRIDSDVGKGTRTFIELPAVELR